ncbi:MAG: Cytochrome bd terminal oxidase subunit I, partial [uncultured Quadrisphaera sp.]
GSRRARPDPPAVRGGDDLPLPVRAAVDQPGRHRRRPADRVGAHRARAVPAADPARGQAAHRHLHRRRGHRAGAGVPVRHGLERLRPLLRRRLRAHPRHRGHARLLPRGHLPRPVVLRLGPAAAPGAPGHDLGRGAGHAALGLRHPRRQLLHAEPRGLRARPGHRPRPAHQLHRAALQRGQPRRLPAHHRGRRDGRRGAAALHRRLAPVGARRRLGRRPRRLRRPGPGRRLDHPGRRRAHRPDRRPAGQDHHPGAADEDGGGRGPVRDHRRRPLLGGRHRRARRRRAVLEHRRPLPALDPRGGPPHRPGGGAERPAAPVRRAVRPRRLHPLRAGGVLVLPPHDRRRHGRRGPGPGLPVDDPLGPPPPRRPPPRRPLAPARRALRAPAARRRQHLRVGVHRERPPALARLRHLAHRGRDLARADRPRGAALAGPVRPGLRAARRGLAAPGAAPGPPGPRGPRGRRARGRARRRPRRRPGRP